MAAIRPERVAAKLTETLTQYGRLTQDTVQRILESVGDEAKTRAASLSPKGRRRGSGKYKRGWKVKIEESGSKISVIVHNRRYQLTHLLEFGHRTRLRHGRYGRQAAAAAQPHIGEVNAWAQRELERRIRKALGGG